MLAGRHLHTRVEPRCGLAGQEGDSSLWRTRRQSSRPSHGAVEGVPAKSDALLLWVKVLASERWTRRDRRGCGRSHHWSRGFSGGVHKVLQVCRCLWPLAHGLIPGVGRLLVGVCWASTTVARLNRRTLYWLKATPGARATMLSERSRSPHLPLPLPAADVSRSRTRHWLLRFHGERHVPRVDIHLDLQTAASCHGLQHAQPLALF